MGEVVNLHQPVGVRCGHPGQSCIETKGWHLKFSRTLTKEEWDRLTRLIDVDPRTFDPDTKEFDALAIGDLVHGIASDVTMEYRSKES